MIRTVAELETVRTPKSLLSFPLLAALVGVLCLTAYVPAVKNGFIADDYVILERIPILKGNPWYLFQVVPENFRTTSYLVFGVLRSLFGYDSRWFYSFTICLHFVNCLLFYKLLRRLDDTSAIPMRATLLFAVFQAPQEAVMWIAAMNEGLQAFFILSAMLLWDRRRHFYSVLCFSLALISKESAAIMLLMIPLWQAIRRRPLFPREFLWYLVPASLFSAVFLFTVSQNFMLASGAYVIGFQAPIVIFKTLFRLTWPWLYIVIGILVFQRSPVLNRAEIAAYTLWLAIPMLPYMFISYQHHLPSRQLYMASMVLACLFARLVEGMKAPVLRIAFVVGFIAFNIQYLWFKKEPQFLERASSTTQLVAHLRTHTPTRVLLIDFPYPQAAIPQAAALAVAGWRRDLIRYGNIPADCPSCLVLQWDEKDGTLKVRQAD